MSELTVFVTNTKTLVCALVSRLNYCNTIFFSVKEKGLKKKKILLHEYLTVTLLQRYFSRQLLSTLLLRCLKIFLQNNRL